MFDAFENRRCDTCVMWEKTGKGQNERKGHDFGDCRRFPPERQKFPETWDDQVCGEHTALGCGQIPQLKR